MDSDDDTNPFPDPENDSSTTATPADAAAVEKMTSPVVVGASSDAASTVTTTTTTTTVKKSVTRSTETSQARMLYIAVGFTVLAAVMAVTAMATLHWCEFRPTEDTGAGSTRTVIGLLKCVVSRDGADDKEFDIDECGGQNTALGDRLQKAGVAVLACGSLGLLAAFVGIICTLMHASTHTVKMKLAAVGALTAAALFVVGGTFAYSAESFVGYSFVFVSYAAAMIMTGFMLQAFGGAGNVRANNFGLATVSAGVLFAVVGMATPQWTVVRADDDKAAYFGLTTCEAESGNTTGSYSLTSDECERFGKVQEVALTAARFGLAFGCVGMILVCAALLAQAASKALDRPDWRRRTIGVGVVGALSLFGAVFGYSGEAWIGYSFVLFSNAALFFIFGAGAVLFSSQIV